MSRGFVKEGDQEEIPLVVPRAFLPDNTPNYVTASGMDALNKEKADIIAERDGCDDNYVKRNYLNACLEQLETRLNSAVLRETKNTDKVDFGLWVSYSIDKEKAVVRIVGVDEADAKKSLISFLSPMAKSIMWKKKGDTIDLSTPQGTKKLEILEITDKAPKIQKKEKVSNKETATENVKKKETIDRKDDSSDKSIKTDDKSKEQPKPQSNTIEFVPIVNERGIIIGQAQRWQVHNGSKLLHPVVHLHVVNSKKEIYLQKRPTWKKIQPGKWDTAVGGHVSFGEKTEVALKREAKEELGISDFKAKQLKQYIWESPVEKELVTTFKTIYDGIIAPSEETDGGRFWTHDEIKESMGKGIFTPNLEKELKTIPELLL